MNESSFQNKSSFTTSLEYCTICFTNFNLNLHKPLLVCRNDHSMCKMCLLAIRSNLRCPYCRLTIFLNQIRLHQNAIDYVNSKSKPSPQFSNHQGHISTQKTPEKLITEQTCQDQIQKKQFFLNESEFIGESIRVQSIQSVSTYDMEQNCSIFTIFLFIYFLLLELPAGFFNVYLGFFYHKNQCMYSKLPNSSLTLNFQLQITGFFEIISTVLFVYFTISRRIGILNIEGLLYFQLMLMFLSLSKSFFGLLIYLKFTNNQQIMNCSHRMQQFININIWITYLKIILGFYLLFKLFNYFLND